MAPRAKPGLPVIGSLVGFGSDVAVGADLSVGVAAIVRTAVNAGAAVGVAVLIGTATTAGAGARGCPPHAATSTAPTRSKQGTRTGVNVSIMAPSRGL